MSVGQHQLWAQGHLSAGSPTGPGDGLQDTGLRVIPWVGKR